MSNFRYNVDIDGLDVPPNNDISVNVVTDGKISGNLFKNQSKKRNSFVDLCGDDSCGEGKRRPFFDKSAHHDIFDLLKDLPAEICNKQEVVDLTLEESKKRSNDQCFPDECLSTNVLININHPLKEMFGNLKGCDINAVIEEIEEYKSGFSGSTSKEGLRRPCDPEVPLPEPKRRKISPRCNNDGEYRDFSFLTYEELHEEIGSIRAKPGQPQELFPVKLHKILEQAEVHRYSSVISWLDHGRAFKMHNKYQFIEQIMPKYFFQTKLESFQRQLKIYGFYKLRYGLDKGAYCHELFLRGRPGLCAGIARGLSNRTIVLQKEPNFYEMPPLSPTQTAVLAANNEPRPIVYVPKENGIGSNAKKPID